MWETAHLLLRAGFVAALAGLSFWQTSAAAPPNRLATFCKDHARTDAGRGITRHPNLDFPDLVSAIRQSREAQREHRSPG
jgi:hypothetical protein